MAEVLVSGYYGFGNAGDEAILAGIAQSVAELDPGVRLVAVSGNPAATTAQHGIAAVGRTDIAAILRAVRKSRLVLSGGGGLLQDVTSPWSIPYYLAVAMAGKLCRRPVMFYAQGVGPVNSALGRTLMRLGANRVDLITVRDDESARALNDLGVSRPPVVVTADAALALGPGDAEAGRALLAQAGLPRDGRPWLGVCVRPWQVESGAFWQQLAAGLDRLAEVTGGRVVFIPMQVPQDVQAARTLAARMAHPACHVAAAWHCRAVRDAIAALDLVIGLRYHALVFAAISGVPMVGLSYDPKNDSFLRLIGQRAVGSTRALLAADLAAAGQELLAEGSRWTGAVAGRVASLARAARQNARLALELLGR